MLNFRKGLKFRVLSLIVAGIFICDNLAYGIVLPEKKHLRMPLLFSTNKDDSVKHSTEFDYYKHYVEKKAEKLIGFQKQTKDGGGLLQREVASTDEEMADFIFDLVYQSIAPITDISYKALKEKKQEIEKLQDTFYSAIVNKIEKETERTLTTEAEKKEVDELYNAYLKGLEDLGINGIFLKRLKERGQKYFYSSLFWAYKGFLNGVLLDKVRGFDYYADKFKRAYSIPTAFELLEDLGLDSVHLNKNCRYLYAHLWYLDKLKQSQKVLENEGEWNEASKNDMQNRLLGILVEKGLINIYEAVYIKGQMIPKMPYDILIQVDHPLGSITSETKEDYNKILRNISQVEEYIDKETGEAIVIKLDESRHINREDRDSPISKAFNAIGAVPDTSEKGRFLFAEDALGSLLEVMHKKNAFCNYCLEFADDVLKGDMDEKIFADTADVLWKDFKESCGKHEGFVTLQLEKMYRAGWDAYAYVKGLVSDYQRYGYTKKQFIDAVKGYAASLEDIHILSREPLVRLNIDNLYAEFWYRAKLKETKEYLEREGSWDEETEYTVKNRLLALLIDEDLLSVSEASQLKDLDENDSIDAEYVEYMLGGQIAEEELEEPVKEENEHSKTMLGWFIRHKKPLAVAGSVIALGAAVYGGIQLYNHFQEDDSHPVSAPHPQYHNSEISGDLEDVLENLDGDALADKAVIGSDAVSLKSLKERESEIQNLENISEILSGGVGSDELLNLTDNLLAVLGEDNTEEMLKLKEKLLADKAMLEELQAKRREKAEEFKKEVAKRKTSRKTIEYPDFQKSVTEDMISVDPLPPKGSKIYWDLEHSQTGYVLDKIYESVNVATGGKIHEDSLSKYNGRPLVVNMIAGTMDTRLASLPCFVGYAPSVDEVYLSKPYSYQIYRDQNGGAFYIYVPDLKEGEEIEIRFGYGRENTSMNDFLDQSNTFIKGSVDKNRLQEDIQLVLAEMESLPDTEKVSYLEQFSRRSLTYPKDPEECKRVNEEMNHVPGQIFYKIDQIRKVDCDTANFYCGVLLNMSGVPIVMASGFLNEGYADDIDDLLTLEKREGHGWLFYYDRQKQQWIRKDFTPYEPQEPGDIVNPAESGIEEKYKAALEKILHSKKEALLQANAESFVKDYPAILENIRKESSGNMALTQEAWSIMKRLEDMKRNNPEDFKVSAENMLGTINRRLNDNKTTFSEMQFLLSLWEGLIGLGDGTYREVELQKYNDYLQGKISWIAGQPNKPQILYDSEMMKSITPFLTKDGYLQLDFKTHIPMIPSEGENDNNELLFVKNGILNIKFVYEGRNLLSVSHDKEDGYNYYILQYHDKDFITILYQDKYFTYELNRDYQRQRFEIEVYGNEDGNKTGIVYSIKDPNGRWTIFKNGEEIIRLNCGNGEFITWTSIVGVSDDGSDILYRYNVKSNKSDQEVSYFGHNKDIIIGPIHGIQSYTSDFKKGVIFCEVGQTEDLSNLVKYNIKNRSSEILQYNIYSTDRAFWEILDNGSMVYTVSKNENDKKRSLWVDGQLICEYNEDGPEDWDVSGDRKKIFYTTSSDSIFVYDGAKVQKILVPDYTEIYLYSSNSNEPIYAAKINGAYCLYKGEQKITKDENLSRVPEICEKGEIIIYVGRENKKGVAVYKNGSPISPFGDDIIDLIVSNDGKHCYYIVEQAGQKILYHNERRISPSGDAIRNLRISKDRLHSYYILNEGGKEMLYHNEDRILKESVDYIAYFYIDEFGSTYSITENKGRVSIFKDGEPLNIETYKDFIFSDSFRHLGLITREETFNIAQMHFYGSSDEQPGFVGGMNVELDITTGLHYVAGKVEVSKLGEIDIIKGENKSLAILRQNIPLKGVMNGIVLETGLISPKETPGLWNEYKNTVNEFFKTAQRVHQELCAELLVNLLFNLNVYEDEEFYNELLSKIDIFGRWIDKEILPNQIKEFSENYKIKFNDKPVVVNLKDADRYISCLSDIALVLKSQHTAAYFSSETKALVKFNNALSKIIESTGIQVPYKEVSNYTKNGQELGRDIGELLITNPEIDAGIIAGLICLFIHIQVIRYQHKKDKRIDEFVHSVREKISEYEKNKGGVLDKPPFDLSFEELVEKLRGIIGEDDLKVLVRHAQRFDKANLHEMAIALRILNGFKEPGELTRYPAFDSRIDALKDTLHAEGFIGMLKFIFSDDWPPVFTEISLLRQLEEENTVKVVDFSHIWFIKSVKALTSLPANLDDILALTIDTEETEELRKSLDAERSI